MALLKLILLGQFARIFEKEVRRGSKKRRQEGLVTKPFIGFDRGKLF